MLFHGFSFFLPIVRMGVIDSFLPLSLSQLDMELGNCLEIKS